MMTMNELLNLIRQSETLDDLKLKIKEHRENEPSFEGGGGANRLLRREREAAP